MRCCESHTKPLFEALLCVVRYAHMGWNVDDGHVYMLNGHATRLKVTWILIIARGSLIIL